MNTDVALFPRLLGAAFNRLDAPLQHVHGGVSGAYRGTASVERGEGWLASLACGLARLPCNTPEAPLRFCLRSGGQEELWTRHFSGSRPMVSRVWQEGGHLVERLGPATLHFVLSEADGVLHWHAESLSVMGIPVPRRAFDFQAWVRGRGARYRFEIDARMAVVGRLIRYRGVLDVSP
jgi:hypothetical protein